MSTQITVKDTAPKIVCPHCKELIYIHLSAYSQDVTKIFEDKCPKCRGNIFTCLFILSDRNMKNLLQAIKAVTATINNSQLYTGE